MLPLGSPSTNLDPTLTRRTFIPTFDAYCGYWCAALLPLPDGGKGVTVLSEPCKVNLSLVITPIAVRPLDVQTAGTILGL